MSGANAGRRRMAGKDDAMAAAYVIGLDLIGKHRGDFGTLPLSGHLMVERDELWDGNPTHMFIIRCSVCRADLWACNACIISSKGNGWLRSEIQRFIDEEALNTAHRHDGSKVKSAGKQ